MDHIREISFNASLGGTSSKVAISTTSAQSAALGSGLAASLPVLVTPDATCFCRQGSNPTAVSDGTDQILLANNTYRMYVSPGNKLAFIVASGTGNVYLTPDA